MMNKTIVANLIDYKPTTGKFYWKENRGKMKAGDPAGYVYNATQGGNPHLHMMIKGKRHAASKIAWLLYHGVEPVCKIEHKNGDTLDYRISNLRMTDIPCRKSKASYDV